MAPHGIDVFGANWNCPCNMCKPRRDATYRLVNSFSGIPRAWVEELAISRDDFIRFPGWGTLFIPKEDDVHNIRELFEEITVENEEDQAFADAGWKEVGHTGIYAIEYDDELLLGIEGAGYDFYANHWSKLYDALGHQWHECGRLQ